MWLTRFAISENSPAMLCTILAKFNIIYYIYSDLPKLIWCFFLIGVAENSVCSSCFYRNRTKPITCYHHNARNRVYLKWNVQESRHETTNKSIRSFPDKISPQVTHFAMCDPCKGNCKDEWCTFAHGRAEQKAWNGILRDQRTRDLEGEGFYVRAYHPIPIGN